jgi:hypothetical protein
VWDPSPWLSFPSGSTATLDLNVTLPAGVRRGGVYGLAPTSRALPAGVTLTSSGLLRVVNATPGTTNGIVFSYSEPA